MKSLLFLMALVLFISCSDSDYQTIQGDWKFAYYESQNLKEYPPDESNTVSVKFNSSRKFYGSSLCNEYWGNYIELEGMRLDILALQSTEQSCNINNLTEWEQEYFQYLSEVISYETIGTTLTLYAGKPLIKMVYVQE